MAGVRRGFGVIPLHLPLIRNNHVNEGDACTSPSLLFYRLRPHLLSRQAQREYPKNLGRCAANEGKIWD